MLMKYPEAGMFGCLLLYPARNDQGEYYMYNVQGESFTNERPDHFGSGLILENGTSLKTSWKSIEVNTTKLGKLPGQRLEDAISADPLLTRLGISIQLMNGHTTETWITAFEDEKSGERIYQIPVRLFHHESRDTKRIKDQSKAQWK